MTNMRRRLPAAAHCPPADLSAMHVAKLAAQPPTGSPVALTTRAGRAQAAAGQDVEAEGAAAFMG